MMNEMLDYFIKTCTVTSSEYVDGRGNVTTTYFDKEKFAELIVTRCASIVSLYRRDNMQDKAIADTLESAYQEIRRSFGMK